LESNFQPNIELSIQKRIIILLIDFMAARPWGPRGPWSSNFLDAFCLKKLKLKHFWMWKTFNNFNFETLVVICRQIISVLFLQENQNV
jgi:hypothetical protein